jgi:hypothetical protein
MPSVAPSGQYAGKRLFEAGTQAVDVRVRSGDEEGGALRHYVTMWA